jgi:hypothetical protein
VPGVGLWPNDYIAGSKVVCGFDPIRGEDRPIPLQVAACIRLIEREAA